jgi:hypothetical protein
MGVPDPTGRWHLMSETKKGNTNGSEEQPLAGFVDKAKEVAETVVEKAGPAMEKAKEVAGTVVEKAGPAMEKAKESATELVDRAKEFLANKDEGTTSRDEEKK